MKGVGEGVLLVLLLLWLPAGLLADGEALEVWFGRGATAGGGGPRWLAASCGLVSLHCCAMTCSPSERRQRESKVSNMVSTCELDV